MPCHRRSQASAVYHIAKYAKDNALFVKDFVAAYTKLTELGTKGLKPVML